MSATITKGQTVTIHAANVEAIRNAGSPRAEVLDELVDGSQIRIRMEGNGAVYHVDPGSLTPVDSDKPETITVTLHIENIYVDHGTVETVVETEVTAPPAAPAWENGDYFDGPADYANAMENHRDAYAEWEADQFLNHTGAGLEGDAGYFVTVTESSDPDKLPVGTKIEFC